MKNSVIIKSFPNGIVLHLDPELPFELLLEDVAEKFRESNSFFKDARMALSIKGRVLSDLEEQKILDAISQNSDLKIICLVAEDETTNQHFIRALQQADSGIEGTESSIVILGDVYPGSAIISAKDIIVLGGLFGEAYAGGNGSKGHFVAALEMSPEKLKIGDFKYLTKEKGTRWSIKPKVLPKIAYVREERVVIDSITKELLSELPL